MEHGPRFANNTAGYHDLVRFAHRWRQRRWAIEGCHGACRSLAQRLVADGERVVDVPAKLAARVRVFSAGHGRKTDHDDAISMGFAALDATGLHEVALDDATVTPGLLSDRRQELVTLRTQAVCRLHRLLAELTPGGVGGELSATKAAAVLARLRPGDEPGRIRRQLAKERPTRSPPGDRARTGIWASSRGPFRFRVRRTPAASPEVTAPPTGGRCGAQRGWSGGKGVEEWGIRV